NSVAVPVPAPNLTREQAQQRAGLLSVSTYDIELDLTDGRGGPGEGTFGSKTTIRFSARRPGQSSWVDIVAEGVREATLNGRQLDVSAYTEDEGIAMPYLPADNEPVVNSDWRYMNSGEGLHRLIG